MKSLRIVLVLSAVMLFHTVVLASEYFVNKQGNDANDGQSKVTAFLTIRKGVDVLKPGDTLTIGPGEYFENVKSVDLGSMDADIVIRSEIPGTVLMRGDVPLSDFTKVDGYHFVYSASLDQKPFRILQHDTLSTLTETANIADLDFDPGSYHYDAESKTLYMSRADLSSPEKAFYTIGVLNGHGIELVNPKRVIIEGLAFTGFQNEWGICLLTPYSCVVRNCVFYMNIGGVVLCPLEDHPSADSGRDNIVENSVFYANAFAGVARYYANNDIVRNCYMYKNIGFGEHFGVMHYHGMPGPFLIQNNISWGHNFDFSVKPGPQNETLENCVGLGHIRIAPDSMVHSLLHGANEYGGRGTASGDNVLFSGYNDLDWDKEFADSKNLDFRLQPDSQFRGASPDGSDRGPYQYEANVFYVSPEGDNEADGLSSRTSWNTLERALKDLRPGDTLYLSGGEYAGATWENAGSAEKPINIRGRGRDPVIITGSMALNAGTGILFERITFADTITLTNCADVKFNNCVFSAATEGLYAIETKGLRLTHDLFTNGSLKLTNCSNVFLRGNLYAVSGKPAVFLNVESDVLYLDHKAYAEDSILYSDYNSYKDATVCWQIGGKQVSLADLKDRYEVYSLVMDPQLVPAEGLLVLENMNQLMGRGPDGTVPGIYLEYVDRVRGEVKIVGPVLHSSTDTTADIEWWSTAGGRCSISWGETPEMTETIRDYNGGGRFNTFSLTGLKPNQKYYLQIQSSRRDGAEGWQSEVLTFTTAAAPAAPCVYYVAPDGNDANSGLSRDQAFRTVNCAADKVRPGDTVMLAEGEYNESVHIRVTGTPERPITFTSIPGEQGALYGAYLGRAVSMIRKSDYRFDGMYFREWDMFSKSFVLKDSPRVQFTRCIRIALDAANSPDLLVRNCVIGGDWYAIKLSGCGNSVIENNVFLSTILRHVSTSDPITARNNIFGECIRGKCHQQLLDIRNVNEGNNCFHLRWPAEEKQILVDTPLPVYCARTGSDSFAANPMMAGLPGQLLGWQLTSDTYFSNFFPTNPKLIVRGIGLQPLAFVDIDPFAKDWPYTREWAEKVLADMDAAEALVKAGNDDEALAAYTLLAADTPLSPRLKSDVLEKASCCAQRLKRYEKAIQLAKYIPIEPIAIKRQMEIMLARKQYDALLDAFSTEALGGREFHNAFAYPELEDLMADLYYYRSIAYSQTGDLDKAEADLRIVNDKRKPTLYTSGESVHDLVSFRLGNFYRDYRKDDAKALEAYLEVCSRKTWAFYGIIDKPLSTGASQTLVDATKAACEILTKQGDLDKVKELQESLKTAQEKAAAALQPGNADNNRRR